MCHHNSLVSSRFSRLLSQHLSSIDGVLAPAVVPNRCRHPGKRSGALALAFLPAQLKNLSAVHCEDSQLLKHHGCTTAEDTVGKVPQRWIPPLPQKPQTLHIMPVTERKRTREERGRRDRPVVGGGMRK